MATCPECEFDEIETADYEEGDTFSCPECGKNLVLLAADEVEIADDEDEDLDEDEDDEDDEDEVEDDEDDDDARRRGTRRVSEARDDVSAARSRSGALFDGLARFDSVIVAFSGGVDSAYLAWVATGARATARCASRPTVPVIPTVIASSRCRSRAISAFATRSSGRASSNGPSTARTRQPLLLLQARAVYASDAHRRASAGSRRSWTEQRG